MYIYKRGFLSWEEIKFLTYSFSGVGLFLAFAYFLRAYGRASNPVYLQFIDTLYRPTTNQSSYIESIRKYDFEFYAWPSSFTMKQMPR